MPVNGVLVIKTLAATLQLTTYQQDGVALVRKNEGFMDHIVYGCWLIGDRGDYARNKQ